MDDKFLTLNDAAVILGWDYQKIKTMARRNKFPTVDIPFGKERVKKGISRETLALLKADEIKDLYHEMVTLMQDEMRNGVWDGKGRVLTDKWINANKEYLDRYWVILGVKASILGVSPENLKIAMSSFEIDRENKRDHYSTKMHMYKAVCNLTKVLVREGYKTKSDLDDMRLYRPGKLFLVKRDFLDIEDVQKAISLNLCWRNGRADYDVRAFDILLSIYSYAGLRKMEAANLRLDQVFISKGYLHVYGKWAKERIVPIFPVLSEKLKSWIEFRKSPHKKRPDELAYPAVMESKLLVPQIDGTVMTSTSITTRFQRFGEYLKKQNAEIEIAPHALRRSFATIASVNGMSDSLVQRALGHASKATLESYQQVQDRHLVEWAQNFNFSGQKKEEVVEAPRVIIQQVQAPVRKKKFLPGKY